MASKSKVDIGPKTTFSEKVEGEAKKEEGLSLKVVFYPKIKKTSVFYKNYFL